jgi:hypothetical protein
MDSSKNIIKLAPVDASIGNVIGCTNGIRPSRDGGVRLEREEI